MKNKQPYLTLINQSSLTEKEDFQQMWASNLLICFFALTQQLVFLEAL